MLGPASVLQSDHRLAGHPLSPSKDWRPGFSIGLVPILTAGAYVPDDIGISSSAAPPGPYGPARCRLSRRRELRDYGVLRSTCIPGPLPTIPLGRIRAPRGQALPPIEESCQSAGTPLGICMTSSLFL